MSSAPTDLDTIASIFVLILAVVSALTLFGMGILMAAGAVFSKRPLVTSWSPDQEHAFSSYEQRYASANSQAWALSLIGAAVVFVFAIGVYVGVEPDKRDIAKDMNMSNLTKKRTPPPPAVRTESAAPAEAPKADTPAEAPKADTPAEAPKADTPAPEAPKQ